MKKNNKILSVLLATVMAFGSMQFAAVTSSASQNASYQYNVLFEETFEAGYETKTTYGEKEGAWTVSQGDGLTFWQKESQIYPNKGKNGNADFALVEPYSEAMVLKVSADISAGVISANDFLQIDVVGLNTEYTANDDGRISVCHLVNGKIYANCISATDSRDTGATYTAGQRMIVEGIIDEANKTFTLSVYDKTTGNAILEDYNVTPYKHTKSNYYELTHGFTGVRFRGGRASNANQAYTLYDLKVEEVEEITAPEEDPFNVTLFDETFEAGYGRNTRYNGKYGKWSIPETFFQKGSGEASEIHVLKGYEANVDFALNKPYTDKMLLKVSADVVAGVVDSKSENSMRIDVVGLSEGHENNDDGRISLCYLANGKIYANCVGPTDSRDTGAKYTEKQKLTFEGIIDEANKTITLSVYDKDTGKAILKNYNVTPYKHTKSNYYELTHGFTGIRFQSKRASDAGEAFELYDLSVMTAVDPFNVTLLEETFEAGYETKTSYSEKAGAWNVSQGDGLTFWQKESQIYPNKGKSGNADFAFVEPYSEAMVLKVSADISAGVISANDFLQIDVVGLNTEYTANDDGRISVCHMVNGKIYANCISATDSRDTGATYTAGQRMTVEAVIDEANKTFTLSVYDKATGNAILKDYNVTPYKHTKSNYYELTHGFTGIRFRGGRASNANLAYTLYDISVKAKGAVVPEGTFADVAGVTVNDAAVSELSQISTGDKLNVTVDYTNSTGEDKTLYMMVACFDENDYLTSFSYVTKNVAGSVRADAIEIESKELDVAGANKMKIMVWDGLGDIAPLGYALTIE